VLFADEIKIIAVQMYSSKTKANQATRNQIKTNNNNKTLH
jgi:hypothetical protein